MTNTKNLIGFLLIVILSMIAVNNSYTGTYISQLKNSGIPVYQEQDDLYNAIVAAANQYNISPQNAKIDRVWKAMPGYNGIKVDVNSSYKKMKSGMQFDERKLVFVQVPPEIHLDDLPPSPIFRGHPEKPMVSFLINVARGNEYLPEMLATLQRNNVQATFFLEGHWVKGNPDLAKMIAEAGHELGNHSYSHPNMKVLDSPATRAELEKTNQIIEATTGKKVTFFSPPSGSYSDLTVQIASIVHLKTVMWTIDTIDLQKPSPDILIHRVTSKLHPGAMILMHPTDPTVKALERLIIEIKNRNLRIGTVSKLMDEERIIKLTDNLNEEHENDE